MVTSLQLYYFPLSQPSRAVWQLLLENNIHFDGHSINFLKGENKQSDYLKVNPNSLVPALRDDEADLTLRESSAILYYIAEKYKLEKWWPADLKTRALIVEFLAWQSVNIRGVFTEMLKAVLLKQGKPIEEKYRVQIPNTMKLLNDIYLTKHKYVATNDHPTIADLQLYHETVTVQQLGIVDFKDYPLFQNWLREMDRLPHSAAVLDAMHKSLRK